MEIYENFVAVFDKEGTDIEAVKDVFMKNGADDVKVSYDYIMIDDSPDKAVSFFVHGMTWNQCFKTRLELGLHRDIRLPESHYVCLEL